MRKFVDAQRLYLQSTAALSDLELRLEASDSFGMEMLGQWKIKEKKWVENVLDIRKHKKLPNPYEPIKSKGT